MKNFIDIKTPDPHVADRTIQITVNVNFIVSLKASSHKGPDDSCFMELVKGNCIALETVGAVKTKIAQALAP